jgi:hypothetical protein
MLSFTLSARAHGATWALCRLLGHPLGAAKCPNACLFLSAHMLPLHLIILCVYSSIEAAWPHSDRVRRQRVGGRRLVLWLFLSKEQRISVRRCD